MGCKIISTLFMAFLLFFISCNENRGLQTDMTSMFSSSIKIDKDRMLCLNYDKISSMNKPLFRLVAYVDSSECSSCSLGKLKSLESYLKKNVFNKSFQFIIVLESKRDEVKTNIEEIKVVGISTPVLIDSTSIFRQENPQMPNNSILHTFLLNSSDSIVLVGDPLQNEHIDKLFRKIVNE